MQRSSASIAALASALARAQIELTNPEKSLIGTIEPQDGEGRTRQFRYAPLSSGLEIVRKTLGQHEIATLQTTAIDQAAGMVNLTTVLAHASGEWIASDWPVCAISETAVPHRMGAALTYARRYALFTLVGIAGEDDLDAPDLLSAIQSGSRRAEAKKPSVDNSEGLVFAAVRLDAAASAQLRDLMLSELNAIGSEDEAARWAYRRLPEKNKLNGRDAKHIEEIFCATLSRLAVDHVGGVPELTGNTQTSGITNVRGRKAKAATLCVDKSILAHPEPRRIRDRQHVRSVARQTCLVCGRAPCDAHHLRVAQSRALGRKVSDEFTVPLCRGHHRELHRHGDEATWWQTTGIDPFPAARALWLQTHPR